MTTKTSTSIIALMVSLISANSFAVRVCNARIISELNKFYAQMEAEGKLSELSQEARSVCQCLKRGGDYDKDALKQIIHEARKYGYLGKPLANDALLDGRVRNNQK